MIEIKVDGDKVYCKIEGYKEDFELEACAAMDAVVRIFKNGLECDKAFCRVAFEIALESYFK